MAINVNIQLKNYTLEQELSQNDHFTLYLGYHKSDGSAVLIKVVAPLYAGDELFVRRFKQITQKTAQLEHPNVISTYEAEQEGDLLYMVQDYVEASSLAQIIETKGPFSLQRMEFIAGQIASALDYAHQKSVMHGDLSAHQIYLGPDDRVLIANFGQSQAVFGPNLAKQTHVITTPETLAPERVQGQGPSRPADLYALGILCYYMLAKKPPFTGPASTVLHAQAHKQPRLLYQVNASVPISVSKVIDRMLSKGVELRYNTGAEFIRALTTARHHKKPFRQYDPLTPLVEQERRSSITFQTLFYVCSGLVMMIFIAALFAWAGYELGLKQATVQAQPPQLIITPTISLLQSTNDPLLLPSLTPELHDTEASPTPTQTQTNASLVDTLILKPTPTRKQPTVTLIVTTTVSTVTPTPATLPPTPTPAIPAGQSIFVFFNPTGHDLIVDLTGPTSTSMLVPPNQQHEFFLEPGSYQYIVHTPTGEWLETVVANFDLAPGQQIKKDYYSDYDWNQ